MNKGLAIAGGALMLVSLLGLFFGFIAVAGHGPDSENILHDTEFDGDTFAYDGEVVLLEVYAKGDVDCYSFSITITGEDSLEYFYPNCETGTDINGYTYLGDIDFMEAGNYNINAEGDVVIIDADGLLAPVFIMCGGGVCCLVGIILLIVGLSIGRKAPQVILLQQPDGSMMQQTGTMVQPNQTTVHQYIPPVQTTTTQVASVHRDETSAEQVEQSGYEPFSFEHKKDP